MDHIETAKHWLAAERHGEAEKLLQELLHEQPHHAEAWALLGESNFERRNYAQAVAAYERLTALVILSPLTQARLAYGYLRLRKRELACTVLDFLLERASSLDVASLQIATHTALRMNACAQLRGFAQAGVDRFPRVALFWFALGAARRTDNLTVATRFLEAAVARQSNHLGFRISLSRALLDSARRQAAHDCIRNIEVEQICCPANLIRLRTLYAQLDDQASEIACGARLFELKLAVETQFRPED
ncbi:MAG: tetratricopeptide repeat protein [Planctomycetota bacterium]